MGEVSPDGETLTQYVYADKSHVPAYMIRNTVKYKIVSNLQGSVRFVVLATTGAVVQELNYDEYGNVITNTNPDFQPFGFAGGIYDTDTKLTRYGARDYDAEVGRWTAKDPILFNGGDVNLYSYAIQDPVNFIDPEGESAIGLIAAGICTAMTIKDFRDNALELDTLKIELTEQSDKMNKCDNMDDFEREKKKFDHLQKQFSKRKLRDYSKSLGLEALCALLTAF